MTSPTDRLSQVLAELHIRKEWWRADSTEFRRRARVRASLWRTERNLAPGTTGKFLCGSWLLLDEARRKRANWVDETVAAVADEYLSGAAKEPGALIEETRMHTNLLGSQPMCFNLFGAWRRDLHTATTMARTLWPQRVEEVCAVHFEHSPGRGRRGARWLGNGTAFDMVIAHTVPGGGKGFIGVETKYHEDMHEGPDDPAKGRKRAEWRDVYAVRAREAGIFHGDARANYWKRGVYQLWLDHLLAAAMLSSKDNGQAIHERSPGAVNGSFWSKPWDTGLSVVLYPAANRAVADAVDSYRKLVNPSALATRPASGVAGHEVRTLESVLDALRASGDTESLRQFQQRYLNLSGLGAIEEFLAEAAR